MVELSRSRFLPGFLFNKSQIQTHSLDLIRQAGIFASTIRWFHLFDGDRDTIPIDSDLTSAVFVPTSGRYGRYKSCNHVSLSL